MSNRFNANRMSCWIRWFLFSISMTIISSYTYADDATQKNQQDRYKQLQTELKHIQSLPSKNIKTSVLDDFQSQIAALDYTLNQCITDNTEQRDAIQKNQALLGEKQAQEDYAIQVKRVELANQYQEIDSALKHCSLLNIQLKQLAADAKTFQQALIKQQLFAREGSLLPRIERLLVLDNASLSREFSIIQPLLEKIHRSLDSLLFLFALIGAGIGLFWTRKNRLLTFEPKNYASPSLIAVLQGLKRVSPMLLALLAFWLSMIIMQLPPSSVLLHSLQYALLLFFIFGLIRGLLFPDSTAIKRHRIIAHSCLILSWSLLSFTLLVSLFNHEAAGRFSDSVILHFLWLFSLSSAALSAIVLLWIITHKLLAKRKMYGGSLLLMLMLLGSIVAGTMGYRNLAHLIFFVTLHSLIVIFITFLILRISREFFNSLDQGKMLWQRQLRRTMGIKETRAFPGVIWLRMLVFFTTVLMAIVALMSIWGNSHQRIVTMILNIKKGITIGNVTLDVLNIVYALLILITVLSILPFIKQQLVSNWLSHSNLSRGAKEATQTLIGYGGVAIAVLWALYIAGVNFQNLAIVAGALSVGIGFGLQNIVSNFISGIILLFERPIRRGDWVMVGTTEGYVKDISIRSTTIQTFQQADVIVPNSELISNQVTNWLLSDTIGRLQVPIGVAYGSDVSQVMEILEEIANRHPDVIDDHPDFSITVLFLGFGESALNFELRCFVRNVNNRLSVLSAINQGIDREFRKAKIEIPFPQRVVHMGKNEKEE